MLDISGFQGQLAPSFGNLHLCSRSGIQPDAYDEQVNKRPVLSRSWVVPNEVSCCLSRLL